MNNMAKQMDMFDDGGLMDEGGTVDPVSGNDVPPGSTQEEVRDDIPAQLLSLIHISEPTRPY